jgi:hypothetical protein
VVVVPVYLHFTSSPSSPSPTYQPLPTLTQPDPKQAAPAPELTIPQRVEKALASPEPSYIETQLKNIPEGTSQREAVVKHLNQMKKQAVIDAKKRAADEKKALAIEKANAARLRIAYAKKLREKFLDDGMDIKVSTEGKDKDTLHLKYSLFNDVWVHKFVKGSLNEEIGRVGFELVFFDDGYDYRKVVIYHSYVGEIYEPNK